MTARLVTIRFSHYCEKARWALERAHIAFVEEAHVPMLSWLGTLGARGSRTAPVFVVGSRVLPESTDVLRYADEHGDAEPLFTGDAEVERLEERFDHVLGPTVRRVIYFDVLQLPRATVAKLLGTGTPAWERVIARIATPVFTTGIRRGLGVVPEKVARSREAIDTIFSEVEELLRDGRRFLTGDRFTAADLTFASLAAPLIYPDRYAAYALPRSDLSEALHDLSVNYGERPAGQFVMRMYAEER